VYLNPKFQPFSQLFHKNELPFQRGFAPDNLSIQIHLFKDPQQLYRLNETIFYIFDTKCTLQPLTRFLCTCFCCKYKKWNVGRYYETHKSQVWYALDEEIWNLETFQTALWVGASKVYCACLGGQRWGSFTFRVSLIHTLHAYGFRTRKPNIWKPTLFFFYRCSMVSCDHLHL